MNDEVRPKKTCETSGHIWGPLGTCIFCEKPKPGETRRMTMAKETITDRDAEIVELHGELALALASNIDLKAELARLRKELAAKG